jgi:hypothetical protein
MPRRKLKTISPSKIDLAKMSILQMTPDFPAEQPLIGGSETDNEWVCGGCGRVLLAGLASGQVQSVVVRCTCGVYNDATI